MNVTLKAGPGFEDILPANASGDSAELLLEDGASLSELFDTIGLPEDRRCLSAVNDTIVPKAKRAATMLSDGDIVDVLPPLTGG